MEIEVSPTRKNEIVLAFYRHTGLGIIRNVVQGREGTMFIQGDRTASFGPNNPALYVCKWPWPIEFVCIVKDDSIQPPKPDPVGNVIQEVFNAPGKHDKPSPLKGLFQVFIREPNECTIAARAATIEAAEERAWDQWSKIRDCKGHDLQPLPQRHDRLLCSKCGLVTKSAQPSMKGEGK